MPDQNLDQYLADLSGELQKLLDENIAKNPEDVDPKIMGRMQAIRKEIESYGILVSIEYVIKVIDSQTILKSDVTLYKPKLNMTPEEQESYDKWFMEAAERWRKRQDKKGDGNKNPEE